MKLTEKQLRRLIKEELGSMTQIRGREPEKKRNGDAKAVADYNKRLEAEHEKLRDEIINLRPDWSVGALANVTRTWGDPSNPGLGDIVRAIKVVDELAKKFR